MNSAQLAVLLRRYESALDDAIAETEDALPTSMLKKQSGIFGELTLFPCTQGLRALQDGLRNDIKLLERGD